MKKMTLAIVAGLLCLPVSAQDDKAWNEALATWQRLSGSKDAADRARAVEEVGGATYEKRDKQAAAMVLGMLKAELARENNGKKEEAVSNDVLDACVAALQKLKNVEAVDLLVKTAKTKGESPRVRIYVLWALGGLSGDASEKALVELADDPNPSVTIAAVDGLKERKSKQTDLFLKILKDTKRTWEVKLSALQALDATITETDTAAVEALIEGLAACKADEGRVKDEYIKLLTKLVGEIKSDEPGAWRTAWEAKKKGEKPNQDNGTVAEPTEFFGNRTKSTRIVFVLDRTGSMAAPLSVKPKKGDERKEPPGMASGGGKEHPADVQAREAARKIRDDYDKREVKTRMDALKKEFINTIYYMDPKVHFTVVWYEANQQPWKDQLVPATWQNKLEIIKETDKLQPSGGTNVWGGIEYAYKLVEQPNRPDVVALDKKGNYATVINGADTFFLMTDGAHNTGKFVKPNAQPGDSCDVQAFIAELRKVNKLRKVIINTVCLGSEPNGFERPDASLMQQIASETGGSFTHVKDEK
jgi:hypothetical protein